MKQDVKQFLEHYYQHANKLSKEEPHNINCSQFTGFLGEITHENAVTLITASLSELLSVD